MARPKGALQLRKNKRVGWLTASDSATDFQGLSSASANPSTHDTENENAVPAGPRNGGKFIAKARQNLPCEYSARPGRNATLSWAALTYDQRELWGAFLEWLDRYGVMPSWAADLLHETFLAGVDSDYAAENAFALDTLMRLALCELGLAALASNGEAAQ